MIIPIGGVHHWRHRGHDQHLLHKQCCSRRKLSWPHVQNCELRQHNDLIFLLNVWPIPTHPDQGEGGIGNLILTWYRVELSIQMDNYIDDFDTRSALNSIPRWDVVGQKVLKIILLKGDLRRSLALTSSQFLLILMIHYFSGKWLRKMLQYYQCHCRYHRGGNFYGDGCGVGFSTYMKSVSISNRLGSFFKLSFQTSVLFSTKNTKFWLLLQIHAFFCHAFWEPK